MNCTVVFEMTALSFLPFIIISIVIVNSSSEKMIWFFDHFRTSDIERKLFRFLSIFLAGSSKLLSTSYVSIGSLLGIFFEKIHLLIIFGLWVENFGLLSKYFWRGSQNCILRVHRNVLGKFFSFFLCVIFGHWAENFRPPVKIFSEVLSKIHSTCP